jgi:hypothetical protein
VDGERFFSSYFLFANFFSFKVLMNAMHFPLPEKVTKRSRTPNASPRLSEKPSTFLQSSA